MVGTNQIDIVTSTYPKLSDVVALVYVYGTLRAGQPNHRLLKDAVPLGTADIFGTMYSLGGFPCVVRNTAHDTTIDGHRPVVRCEVYAVNKETLASLDRLEGYVEGREYNMYDRLLLDYNNVSLDDRSGEFKAVPSYVYVFLEAPNGRGSYHIISSGDWVEFVQSKKPL